MKRVMILSMVSLLAACSSEQAYEGRQQGAQNECRQLPPSQIDACVEQNSQSYDAYRREREARTQ